MNRLGIDQTEKTTPVGTDRIIQTDSADSNNTVWSTLTNLATSIFGLKTTTDLPEGTNEYFTDAKVTANTTVVALGNDKSDKTNVLELDNTTAFTPTADYHPSTKAYVDNKSVPIVATDAQAEAGTNETTFINPKQLKDRQFQTTEAKILSVSTNIATSVVSYSHSLGVTPKTIRFDCTNILLTNEFTGFGVYDGVNNIFKIGNATDFSTTGSARTTGDTGNYSEGEVTAVSDTDFTITWTRVGSPDSGTINILATLSI